MAADLKVIFLSVVASASFAVLAFVYRRLARQFVKRDPRWRPVLLAMLVGVWFASNIGYQTLGFGGQSYFFLISSLVIAFVVGEELNRFWGVGLLAADKTTASGLNYALSLRLCHKSLDFLGVGAAKLTTLTSEFEAAIRRCHNDLRPIRFLLCNPDNPKLETFARQAGDPEGEYRRRVAESLRVITDLRTRKRMNIEVRFYGGDTMPLFRLMFVDDTLCLLSHYRFGAGDGSDLPQIHVRRARQGRPEASAFYYALRLYFERLWEQSTPQDFSAKLP